MIVPTEVEDCGSKRFFDLVQPMRIDVVVVLKDSLIRISEDDDVTSNGETLHESPLRVGCVLELVENDGGISVRHELGDLANVIYKT